MKQSFFFLLQFVFIHFIFLVLFSDHQQQLRFHETSVFVILTFTSYLSFTCIIIILYSIFRFVYYNYEKNIISLTLVTLDLNKVRFLGRRRWWRRTSPVENVNHDLKETENGWDQRVNGTRKYEGDAVTGEKEEDNEEEKRGDEDSRIEDKKKERGEEDDEKQGKTSERSKHITLSKPSSGHLVFHSVIQVIL